MTMSRLPHLIDRLGSIRRDARGVAAIEFALVLPLLLIFYFGVMELVRIIDTSRKVTQYARTIADLSGRATNGAPTIGNMESILSAAGAILRPYPTSQLTVAVHAMGVETGPGQVYEGVCSSYPYRARPVLAHNGTDGLPVTPATQNYDGARYVLAEVSLPYTPVIGTELYRMIFGAGAFSFTRQISWSQRLDKGEVVMPEGKPCPNS